MRKGRCATPSGGASELFTEGISAMGYPQGDCLALAEALLRLIDDPALRSRLGKPRESRPPTVRPAKADGRMGEGLWGMADGERGLPKPPRFDDF